MSLEIEEPKLIEAGFFLRGSAINKDVLVLHHDCIMTLSRRYRIVLLNFPPGRVAARQLQLQNFARELRVEQKGRNLPHG